MPNYADGFARFLQAWPSQPDGVPALDDPLANYPWARGLQPFLAPPSDQQSTPWFDPARQPNLIPVDDNPVAQVAPTVAREVATPPSPPWILAPVHHDPFQGLLTPPYLVPLPVGFNPFGGGYADAFNPSASPHASPSSWPRNADTPVSDTAALGMASGIRDRPQAAAAVGLLSNAATSGTPWWPDRYNVALPNAPRVNLNPAAAVAADFDTDQSLKAWPSDDPYMREGAYAADQAAAAKLRRPDLPGLAYYAAHPDIVAAREAGLGGIAALAGPLPAAALAGIDYAAAAQSGDAPLSAADFDQQPLKPWPSDDPYIREGAYAADQAAAAKLRRPDLAGLAYGRRPDVRAARDAAFAAMPSMLPAGEIEALGGRTRLGVIRNNRAAWRKLRGQWDSAGYGEILGEENRARIAAGLAPMVDEAWIAHFPEDAGLKGQLISMHHIGGDSLTVPLPRTRHRDAHMPGGTQKNFGGPGSAAPFYFVSPVKK
jgi:hypothetical protein